MVAQALGSLGSSVIGAMAANASSFKQFKYQRELQKQAAKLNYQYAQKTAENSPTWNRQGLESAGYNPMLAVQNSTSGVNSSFTSSGNATAPDYVGGISAGIANAQSFQRLKNETDQTESTVSANEATARNQNAEASNKEAENPYISKQNEAQLGKLSAETSYLSHQNDLIDAQIENMSKRLELDRYLGELGYSAQIYSSKYSADKSYAGTVYNADTLFDIAENHSPSGRSGSFKNYSSGVRDILSGLGDVIHGSNDTYENYDESVQHSSRDKKTGVVTTTKSRKSGKRKKK